MDLDVSVHVSQNYKRVAAELKRAASGELKREMVAAIKEAARPAAEDVRAQVPAYMPRRGGYAAALQADLDLRVTTPASGVRISATAKGRDVGARERGFLRHPVYGTHRVSHRRRRVMIRPWVSQRVRPRFFTEPIRRHSGQIQAGVVRAVQKVADRIGG